MNTGTVNRNVLPPGYASRLSRLIKAIMADNQLTQAELARRLGVTQVTISNWKRSILHEPPRKGLEELAREANFQSISELLAFLHGEHRKPSGSSPRQIEQQALDLSPADKISLLSTIVESLKENSVANSNDGSGVLEELNKPHLKRKLKILCEASLAERGWSLDVAKKRLGVPFLSFLLDDSAPFVLSPAFVEKLIQQLLFRVVRWDGSIPIIDPSQSYLSAEELLDSLSNGVHL